MSAVHLIAGTITTDKLSASVGQELEIGSNKSLLLYATVDGYRPSGGLLTQVSNGDGTYRPVAEGDSYIRIAAKEGNSPAYIDIMTGGIMNLQGSTMNLKAKSVMNLTSGDLYVDADGQIHMKSGSDIDIEGGASLTVEAQGNVDLKSGGTLNLTGATANFSSQSTLNLNSNSNMYIGSGGNLYVNSAGRLKIESGSYFSVSSPNFVVTEDGNVMVRGTIHAYQGDIAGISILGDYNSSTKKWTNQRLQAGSTNSLSSTAEGFYIGTDGVNLGGRLKYTIDKRVLYVEAEQLLLGKQSSGSGSLLSMNASTGVIDLLASSTINIAASSAVNITSGKTVTISSSGSVIIGNSGSPFTIGSNGTNAYIYNGMTSLSDASHNGVYVGTDGIALGKGLFKVTNSGALNATSAKITGEVNATTGRIGQKADGTQGWIIDTNLIYADNKNVGLNSAPIPSGQSATIRIWAGDTTMSSAEFYVRSDGYMKSSLGEIGGWIIGTNTLKSTNSLIGLHSKDGTASEIAIWAGNSTASSAPFRVTHGGNMTANNATLNSATIYGNIYAGSGNIGGAITYNADGSYKSVSGGWSVTSNMLYANSYKTGLSSASGDSTVAIWAGAANSSSIASAPFRVTNGGILTATGANLKSASVDGEIEAVSGLIGPVWNSTSGSWEGGWKIASNTISSGNGGNYVALSSNTGSDYAIWAGSNTASSATFSVKRNGTLYASGATVSGTLTAGAGSTIGGWYITSDRIRSGNASGGGITGMASNASPTSNVAFWAGSTTPSSAPFYVTHAGTLNATNATIKGTIKASSLYIGSSSTGDGTQLKLDSNGLVMQSTATAADAVKNTAGIKVDPNGIVLASTNTDPAGAVLKTAGIEINSEGRVLSSTNKTAGTKVGAISLDSAGHIQISSTDVGQSSSGVYLTPSSIRISTSGTFSLDSTYFSVTTAGAITSTSGTIGGFSIGALELKSGSGSSTVALNSNPNQHWGSSGLEWDQPYGIYVGSSDAASAPFRVDRNGKVYLNALMIWNSSTSRYEAVDFSRNFSDAVTVSGGSWGGGDTFNANLKIFNKDTSKQVSITASVDVGTPAVNSGRGISRTAAVIGIPLYHTVNGQTKTISSTVHEEIVDVSAIWDKAQEQFISRGNQKWYKEGTDGYVLAWTGELFSKS